MIRPAKMSEIPQIVDLLNQQLSFGLSKKEYVFDCVKDGLAHVYVNDNNEVIGYITIRKENEFNSVLLTQHRKKFSGKLTYEISHIVVAEEHKRNGIGTAMGEYILDLLKAKGVKVVTGLEWIQKDRGKCDAESIAQNVGFEEVAYLREYFYYFSDKPLPCPHCVDECHCDARIIVKFL